MSKRFAGRVRTAACLVALAVLSAAASERIEMRYLMYDMVADWLDFMGRDLMELPGPCRTPDGEPTLWQKFYKADFKDDAWRTVSVPHDWGVEHAFLPDLPHLDAHLDVTGPGWYRYRFQLENGKLEKGGHVFFACDGAMSFAMVWINGHFVGGWPYGYTPWRVELTKWLNPKGENVLAVRCHNWKDASRWYTGAGLIRECRLEIEPADFVLPGSVFITTPEVTREKASVHVSYEMSKSGKKERSRIYGTWTIPISTRLSWRGGRTATASARSGSSPTSGGSS